MIPTWSPLGRLSPAAYPGEARRKLQPLCTTVTSPIEQVSHQAKRLGRHRRLEQVPTDMSGQAGSRPNRTSFTCLEWGVP